MFRTMPRLLAGSVAVLAAFAGSMSPASMSPAAAATPSVKLKPHLADVTVAVGGDAKIAAVLGWVDLPAGAGSARPPAINQLRVSVDTSGVAGVAAVVPAKDGGLDPSHSCRAKGTVITCTSVGPFAFDEELPLLPLAALEVKADAGAKVGRTGKLVITAQADDGPVSSSTSTVRIGEGVDLAGGGPSSVTAAPGTRATVGLRVSNAGERPVDGAVLLMLGWPDKLLDGPGAGNCRYGEALLCTFTDVLAPGRTYSLSDPVRLRIPADTAAGSSSLAIGLWFTTTEWQELLDVAPTGGDPLPGRPGTGVPTRLEAAVSRAGLPQVDTDPSNNLVVAEVVVGGERRTDVAAIGATVRGAAGDRVKARVGFTTNGSGTLYPELFDNADPGTHVVVPPGLKAVTVDDRCSALSFDDPSDPDSDPDGEPDSPRAAEPGDGISTPGAPEYLCATDAGSLAPGGRTLFDFTFQVGNSPSRTPGEITVNDEEFLAQGGIDRNERNDRAAIAVTVTDADADADGGTGGEGGGDDDGGLPLTGTDAVTVATVGTLLVLAGAVTWLLVRRRRVRFTA